MLVLPLSLTLWIEEVLYQYKIIILLIFFLYFWVISEPSSREKWVESCRWGKLSVSDEKRGIFSAVASQVLCLAFPVAFSPTTCLFSGCAAAEGNPVWPLGLFRWKHWHRVTSNWRNVNFSLNLVNFCASNSASPGENRELCALQRPRSFHQ